MKKLSELSVFFPAYNEEANIKTTVEKALQIVPTVATKCLCFV
jgi:glycosyltransferase involved in cell wall biosynthesis